MRYLAWQVAGIIGIGGLWLAGCGSEGDGGGGGTGGEGPQNPDNAHDAAAQVCVDKINEYRKTLDLPPYERWVDQEICTNGEAESDWRDLVTASIEEHLIEVRHGESGLVSRAVRKDDEHRVLRDILREYATREERVEAWTARTGKSERAFYRRLAELQ